MDKFQDWDNPLYSNIETFKANRNGVEISRHGEGALSMKIAVIGANGQLGSDLVAAFYENGNVACALTHSDIEISDLHSVSHALEDLRPHVVVNTAAMHHIENCEREPEKAFAVNALGPRNLAIVARDLVRF